MNSNSADILLIQCPPWDTEAPPLGIAYLSSYLRQNSHKVSILDLNITLYNISEDNMKYLWEQRSYNWWADSGLFKKTWDMLEKNVIRCIQDNLRDIETEYIGLSVNFAGIRFTSEALKIINSIDSTKKIILGGWGCVNEHMRGLFPKELVDAFVIGEGEETLKEVMEAFKGRREKSKVCGAIFTKEDKYAYEPRKPIMDLDTMPWPTFNEMDLKMYRHRVLPLFTSRGCIGNCSFCNDSPLSKPYRFRSADNIFDEIKHHTENNRITCFAFKDLLCNGNIEQLSFLCGLIINSGLKINWSSQAIPRKEMTYELLCKLKKSGCESLIYGVESFSNNVLIQMRKLFTGETAEKVLKDTHQAGIKAQINIIVGFPGETENDFKETCEAIKRTRDYITQIGAVSVCLVNNDSALELHYEDYGLIMPADPVIRAKKWASTDGKNTYQVRKERAENIINLIERIGLVYQTITI
jgi:hypothetical protein